MPDPRKTGPPQPTLEDFRHLLAFRVSLRRFQHWSEQQARAAGLTHVQHQLLVAVKGHPGELPRLWATLPPTSCCAITVRSGLWIGPRRQVWFSAALIRKTPGWSGSS